MYDLCQGAWFSPGLLHHLLIKLRRALSLKFYLYSALGCKAEKALDRVYCVLLQYGKPREAVELHNPLSHKAGIAGSVAVHTAAGLWWRMWLPLGAPAPQLHGLQLLWATWKVVSPQLGALWGV